MKSNSKQAGCLWKVKLRQLDSFLQTTIVLAQIDENFTRICFFFHYYLLPLGKQHIEDDIDNYWLIKSSCIHTMQKSR